ncbi:MAG: molybdopterin-dependent oxidoreductase [Phycicoccus sp.]|nr:molybdopterin-dependent oxidoreductase [Phycicoccus sp.]NMM34009.1 molybdopterin-dependent oxidoreductase [Phycicoccus sp.]
MAITPTRRSLLQIAAAGTAVAALPVGVRELAHPPAASAAEAPGTETVVTSVCEMCTVRCPILVRVRDGKVIRIEGNPKEKSTQGAICAKGNAGVSLLYDKDRVRTPLIRVGERGEGKFRKATWDEAYKYIADRLKAIRPEELAVGRRPSASDVFLLTFAKAFGTPNIFSHESSCPLGRNVAMDVTLGTSGVAIDYSKVDYLLSFGRNHMETLAVPQAQGIVAGLARGARLVYLDPRRTPTSTAATTWLQPLPGTDLAFVLAMLQVVIAEKLYDQDFVKQYTLGFDQLVDAVGEYTPEWAATQTGIPAATIRDVARDFGTARPRAVADFGWFTASYLNDFQLRRAILALNALAGNLEVPGGIFFVKDLKGYGTELGGWKKPEFPAVTAERVDGAGVPGRFPLVPVKDGLCQALPESVLTGKPYALKAYIAHRFDPLAAIPDQPRMIEAFKKLDLLVSVDVYMSDTGAYADVILPECTYLERTDPVMEASGLAPKIRLRQQVIPLQGDAKPSWQIYQGLAKATGLGAYFAYKDIDEIVAAQLAPFKLSATELAKEGQWAPPDAKPTYLRKTDPTAPVKLKTPSGKIELFSEELAKLGFDPVPRYTAPPEAPTGTFQMIQGKCAVHTNSATQNIPVLHELRPSNELWIHPVPAGRLGIKDGDGVVVRVGKLEQRGVAKVTADILEGTVFTYHGWGRTSPGLTRVKGKGIGLNALLPVVTDPLSGSLVMRETFVEVTKS